MSLKVRVERLEGELKSGECVCSQPVVVFEGEPTPKLDRCPVHDRSRVVRWPLPRTALDQAKIWHPIKSPSRTSQLT